MKKSPNDRENLLFVRLFVQFSLVEFISFLHFPGGFHWINKAISLKSFNGYYYFDKCPFMFTFIAILELKEANNKANENSNNRIK